MTGSSISEGHSTDLSSSLLSSGKVRGDCRGERRNLGASLPLFLAPSFTCAIDSDFPSILVPTPDHQAASESLACHCYSFSTEVSRLSEYLMPPRQPPLPDLGSKSSLSRRPASYLSSFPSAVRLIAITTLPKPPASSCKVLESGPFVV
jgi:hypothetical protein